MVNADYKPDNEGDVQDLRVFQALIFLSFQSIFVFNRNTISVVDLLIIGSGIQSVIFLSFMFFLL